MFQQFTLFVYEMTTMEFVLKDAIRLQLLFKDNQNFADVGEQDLYASDTVNTLRLGIETINYDDDEFKNNWDYKLKMPVWTNEKPPFEEIHLNYASLIHHLDYHFVKMRLLLYTQFTICRQEYQLDIACCQADNLKFVMQSMSSVYNDIFKYEKKDSLVKHLLYILTVNI